MIDVDVLRDRWLEPPEPVIVAHCDCCGDEIYEGEEACAVTNGMFFCKNCCSFGEVWKEE